jgi:glucokinase
LRKTGAFRGFFIAKWVTEQLRNGRNSTIEVKGEITAQDVAIAANTGDPLALAAFERAGKILGIAIVNFLHIFNPARIIFGGGVSKSFDLLLPHINKALKKDVFAPGYLEGLTLTTVALGDDSGLLGALALAREAQIQT